MKVYFGSDRQSWCISRISKALDVYLPANFESVPKEQAELIVLHVTGRNRHTTIAAQELAKSGKSYAVIQYAMKSTRNPDPADWQELWKGAKVVWSYYDLPAPNFYRAPLAAGSDVFCRKDTDKPYMVGTVGNCYQAECIGEVHLATWQTERMALHIGEKFNSNPVVDYFENVTDEGLCDLYNSCTHVSSLRRKEGFEMPAVEALLCGVRPIMFDTPNYRHWFDGLAEFIPEVGIPETVANLKKIFKRKPKPVTDDEISETFRRFNWEKSVKGFWERCA